MNVICIQNPHELFMLVLLMDVHHSQQRQTVGGIDDIAHVWRRNSYARSNIRGNHQRHRRLVMLLCRNICNHDRHMKLITNQVTTIYVRQQQEFPLPMITKTLIEPITTRRKKGFNNRTAPFVIKMFGKVIR